MRNKWQDQSYRNKLINIHREYLKNHPEELERLKKVKLPMKRTKVEMRVLDFLRNYFKENEDFLYDDYDTTKKTFYRPDFQFPNKKIIIEIDGYYRHFTPEGIIRDQKRQNELEEAGWKVYRFIHKEVERNYLFENTKNKILEVLKNG